MWEGEIRARNPELQPAVPAVVLKHVEGGLGEEGGAHHVLVAWVQVREVQLLHHSLTVPQQLVQTQLPAASAQTWRSESEQTGSGHQEDSEPFRIFLQPEQNQQSS